MFNLKAHVLLITACSILTSQLVEGAWSTPVALSSTTSDQPDVAVDLSGNAVAVWQGFDGSNYVIQSASLAYGGSWTFPSTLSAAGQNAQDPEVDVDRSGNAVGIWSRFDGYNSIIQGSTLPLGGSWTSAVNVSSAGANADSCELAMDFSGFVGNAVAVWHRFNGSNFVIQAAELPSGGSWSSPADITPSGQDALIPSIAVDSFGNAVSTSSRFDGTNFTTRASSQLLGLNWNVNYILSSPGNTVNQPVVTVNPLGNAVAVWSEFNGSNYIVKVSTLLLGLAWTGPISLSVSGEDAFDPVAVADNSGNVIVAWVRFDGSNYVAQSKKRNFLGFWGSTSTISNAGEDVGFVDLQMDSSGNIIAVWDVTDGDNSVIQSVKRPKGGSWSSPVLVSDGVNYAYNAVVDVDASGNAVAVWLESNGTTDVVMGSTLPFGT